jgi:SNF2 family DNA or RNA helicase
VVLAGRQRTLYESVRLAADERVRKLLAEQHFEGSMISILDALLKLRQVCDDPRLLDDSVNIGPAGETSAKLAWLAEALPVLVAEGRRILLFSQFTRMLALVAAELDALGLPWLRLTGDTPTAERGAVVARFQRGEVPLFLVSLKAGGVGLNLTAADTVIHLDPWWNPAVEQQASARAHRIGQQKPVLVYRLVAAGSIEERLLAMQARKGALADVVLGPAAAAAAPALSADDLPSLLAPLDDGDRAVACPPHNEGYRRP